MGVPGGTLGIIRGTLAAKVLFLAVFFYHSKSMIFDERVSPKFKRLYYFTRRLAVSKIFRGLFI